jgi:glycosyltransferase involved in cell wall biosynthesis
VAPDRTHDVAIHAPFASSLYEEDASTPTGGAELQTVSLARALAGAGLRVCHIVRDSERLPTARDGVDLVPEAGSTMYNLNDYAEALVAALRRADAAVYIQRTAGLETGLVCAYARGAGRRFVFSSSSTADLTLEAPPEPIGKVGYQLGLRYADEVVVQTEEQRELARRHLGRTPRVIGSFCEPAPAAAAERRAFLWIGGLIDNKDPMSYVALAERVPEASFWLVGSSRGEAWDGLAREVHQAAERLPNLELLGPRPRGELFELYERAVGVVNTSRVEGFPNTFLEGWARGAPALSLNVDPDGVIERHSLGAAAGGSLDRMVDVARSMWQRRGDMSAQSAAARDYVARVHNPAVVGGHWASFIEELLAGPAPRIRPPVEPAPTKFGPLAHDTRDSGL